MRQELTFFVNFFSFFPKIGIYCIEGGEVVKLQSRESFICLFFCALMMLSTFNTVNVLAQDDKDIQPLSTYISSCSCSASISGITLKCSSTLYSRNSVKLSIKMELQKKKSGVYETIKTWSSSKTGLSLTMSEKRAINLLSDYRLKTTFTAGTEKQIKYAYPA